MLPKTAHDIFVEWLSIATLAELEEERLTLSAINVKIISQLEEHDVRSKSQAPTEESVDWRLRASHSQRFGWHQMKAIEHKIWKINETDKNQKNLEVKQKNLEALELQLSLALKKTELKLEEAKLKNVNPTLTLEVERLRIERAAEKARRNTDRAIRYDVQWIQSAKSTLDVETFKKITALADANKIEDVD